MIKKTYDGTVIDDYSIYDRIKQEGNYITNKATMYDYHFMFWDRLSKAPARSLMVLGALATGGLSLLFGLSIPAAAIGAGVLAVAANGIVSLVKAIVNGLKKKWGPVGYKKRRNSARDAFAKNYLERRKEGKTSKKEDKMFEKMAGKVAFNDEFMVDTDAMKRGVNVKDLSLQRQDVIDHVTENEQMAESTRSYVSGGINGFTSFSSLAEGGYVDAKTKKICYEYKHFNNSQNCVEVNLGEDTGAGVVVGGQTIKCLKVEIDNMGAIDLSNPKNIEILKNRELLFEVIKQYPEAVASIPKQFIKDNFGIIEHDSTGFKLYDDTGRELDPSIAADSAQITYFDAFKKAYVSGVNDRASAYVSGETQIIDHITGARSDLSKKGKDYAKHMASTFIDSLANRERATAGMGAGF